MWSTIGVGYNNPLDYEREHFDKFSWNAAQDIKHFTTFDHARWWAYKINGLLIWKIEAVQ